MQCRDEVRGGHLRVPSYTQPTPSEFLITPQVASSIRESEVNMRGRNVMLCLHDLFIIAIQLKNKQSNE